MVVVGQLGQCPSECTKSAQASFFCLHLLFQCSSEFLVWTPLKTGHRSWESGQNWEFDDQNSIIFVHFPKSENIDLTLNLTANLTCPSCPYSVYSCLFIVFIWVPNEVYSKTRAVGSTTFLKPPSSPTAMKPTSGQLSNQRNKKTQMWLDKSTVGNKLQEVVGSC